MLAETAKPLSDDFDIPVNHLITEDDEPVDHFFQDKQAKLEAQRADAERERRLALEAKLRELGHSP